MKNMINKLTGVITSALLITALFTISCTKDNGEKAVNRINYIGFSVSNASPTVQTKSDCGDFIGSIQMTSQEGDAPKMYIHTYLSDIEDNTKATTKGSIIDKDSFLALYQTEGFGLFGYVGNTVSSSVVGSMSAGAKVTYNADDKIWSSSTLFTWGDAKMSFFAYAPLMAPQGGSLSISARRAYPSLSYTNPTDISKQVDLLVATAKDIEKPESNIVPLTFTPALTAVVFKLGHHFKDGKIVSVTLKNVESFGMFSMNDQTWKLYGSLEDYTLNVDRSYTAEEATNQALISKEDEVMFMLPQNFKDHNATIEVKYAKSSDLERVYTLSAPLQATGNWERGKQVTYTISPILDTDIPIFEVEDIPEISYLATTDKLIKVTSQLRKNGEVANPNYPWSVEYSIDEGVTYSATAPEWLSITRDSDGNALLNAIEQTPTVTTSGEINWDPAKGAPGAEYNLANQTGGEAIENTANCYVINAPGYYKIPLVYGNGIKNGVANPTAYTTPKPETGAEPLNPFMNSDGAAITSPYICSMQEGTVTGDIVWQDSQDLVTNVGITGSGEKAFITFQIQQASLEQGNAVIAAKINGVVAWSWHIWATDYRLGEGDVTMNSNTFMPYNLGWCHFGPLTTKTYADRKCKVKFIQEGSGKSVIQDVISTGGVATDKYNGNNTYYEWGRKDPFPGCKDNTAVNAKEKLTPSGLWSIEKNVQHSYDEALQNPGKLFSINDNWCKTFYSNAWNASNLGSSKDGAMNIVKTIYDPSPVGYCVPDRSAYNDFTEKTTTISPNKEGRNWGELFFPVTGYRGRAGDLYNVYNKGYYWSSSESDVFGSDLDFMYRYALYFHGRYDDDVSNDTCAAGYAYTVRSIREK